jgi:L-threonine kinase
MTLDQLTRPAAPSRAVGVSSAFGTFGELLQGALPDGTEFLVTLPISRWATVTFTHDRYATEVRTYPQTKSKARRATEAMLTRYGAGGGRVEVTSCLPEGKGLASSSADLTATVRAVGNALGVPTPPALIEELLRPIEPTDGVMYPGIVAFEHRNVRLRAHLGGLPPMTVVGIDEGGAVDTVAFNRIPKNFTDAHREAYASLLDTAGAAIAAGDVSAAGRVATRSAYLNQRLCPKRSLAAMTALSAEVGGVGVVAAHSGTTVGLLLPHDIRDFRRRLATAVTRCAQLGGGRVLRYQTLCFDSPGDVRHAL